MRKLSWATTKKFIGLHGDKSLLTLHLLIRVFMIITQNQQREADKNNLCSAPFFVISLLSMDYDYYLELKPKMIFTTSKSKQAKKIN